MVVHTHIYVRNGVRKQQAYRIDNGHCTNSQIIIFTGFLKGYI